MFGWGAALVETLGSLYIDYGASRGRNHLRHMGFGSRTLRAQQCCATGTVTTDDYIKLAAITGHSPTAAAPLMAGHTRRAI